MLEAQKIAIKVYANQDDSTWCPKKPPKTIENTYCSNFIGVVLS